jgi:hypothetical protein
MFPNARHVRTDRNMVKPSSPNAPSTWLIFLCPRTHTKTTKSLTFIHFSVTLFNVGNVLLCVIYQLNFTVFMYVTQVSRYTQCSVLPAVSRDRSKPLNVLGHCCNLPNRIHVALQVEWLKVRQAAGGSWMPMVMMAAGTGRMQFHTLLMWYRVCTNTTYSYPLVPLQTSFALH